MERALACIYSNQCDFSIFDAYNKKFGSDGSHEALDWKECTERVEEFKRQFIHQNIIDTEIDDMSYPFYTAASVGRALSRTQSALLCSL